MPARLIARGNKKGVKLHNSRRMSVYAQPVRFVVKGSKRKIKLQGLYL